MVKYNSGLGFRHVEQGFRHDMSNTLSKLVQNRSKLSKTDKKSQTRENYCNLRNLASLITN